MESIGLVTVPKETMGVADISNSSGFIVLAESDKHPDKQTKSQTDAAENNTTVYATQYWIALMDLLIQLANATCSSISTE